VTDRRYQRLDSGVGFAVDVDSQIRPRRHKFGQGGDVFGPFDCDGSNFGRIEIVDLGVDATGPQEIIVVEREQHPVA